MSFTVSIMNGYRSDMLLYYLTMLVCDIEANLAMFWYYAFNNSLGLNGSTPLFITANVFMWILACFSCYYRDFYAISIISSPLCYVVLPKNTRGLALPNTSFLNTNNSSGFNWKSNLGYNFWAAVPNIIIKLDISRLSSRYVLYAADTGGTTPPPAATMTAALNLCNIVAKPANIAARLMPAVYLSIFM